LGCPTPSPDCYTNVEFFKPEIFEVTVIKGDSYTFDGVVETIFQDVRLTEVDLYCESQSDSPRLCDRIFFNGDSSI